MKVITCYQSNPVGWKGTSAIYVATSSAELIKWSYSLYIALYIETKKEHCHFSWSIFFHFDLNSYFKVQRTARSFI
jgi:hypothetical protein